MKKVFALLLGVFLSLLSACEVELGADADLVFVNESDTVIVSVLVDFQDQSGGAQIADGSPLKRGETFGFEAGEYPVTVLVYDMLCAPFEKPDQPELARFTIPEAPPEGERWYVIARDGADGLTLSARTAWLESEEAA